MKDTKTLASALGRRTFARLLPCKVPFHGHYGQPFWAGGHGKALNYICKGSWEARSSCSTRRPIRLCDIFGESAGGFYEAR